MSTVIDAPETTEKKPHATEAGNYFVSNYPPFSFWKPEYVSALESVIMDQINEFDKELGEKIQDLMLVFDDLAMVDDRGIQALLREVSSETLVVALKGSEEALKEKVFKNMSKRAGEMLRDDLEAKGPVRLSEVEAAQKEILAIARRLSESGDISLGGKGGEEYV